MTPLNFFPISFGFCRGQNGQSGNRTLSGTDGGGCICRRARCFFWWAWSGSFLNLISFHFQLNSTKLSAKFVDHLRTDFRATLFRQKVRNKRERLSFAPQLNYGAAVGRQT